MSMKYVKLLKTYAAQLSNVQIHHQIYIFVKSIECQIVTFSANAD